MHEHGLRLTPWEEPPHVDALVAAVAHQQYLAMPLRRILDKLKPGSAFIEIKAAYDATAIREAGRALWRL